ncbi:MAG: complex I subunit 1 family protein [Armatimonadota bacterium]
MEELLKGLNDGTVQVLGITGSGPVILSIIKALLMVLTLFQLVPGMIWFERRLLSWMQDRIGPNRTGTITFNDAFPIPGLRGKRLRTFGLIQLMADGVKAFLKEDIVPTKVDRIIYFLAPVLALFPAFCLCGTLPFAPNAGIYKYITPIADVDFGILYILAVSSLASYGVVLAGYSSNNKYSLMGGLRASAQLISYELGMGMAAASIVLASGSMRLTEIVHAQEGQLWGFVPAVQNWFIFTPFGFVSAVIFLICMLAETNRAPFDLAEAENELIAGYMTEYGSKKFVLFSMGEYVAMFTFSGVFATLFLGGYNLMPFRWEELAHMLPAGAGLFKAMAGLNYWLAPLGFLAKGSAGIMFFIWARATLPRLRYDQLMKLGWQTLLPVGVANLVVVCIWIMATGSFGAFGGWGSLMIATVILVVLWLNIANATKTTVSESERRKVKMVDPSAPVVKG